MAAICRRRFFGSPAATSLSSLLFARRGLSSQASFRTPNPPQSPSS